MQPNIIMILIDDLGWMDLSCQGSSFETRTSKPSCCGRRWLSIKPMHYPKVCFRPAAPSILSGKYPARLKVTDWIERNYHPCRGD